MTQDIFDFAEGDTNLSPNKTGWLKDHVSAEARGLLEEDARWFIHQSLSTPCLDAIAGAEGIYLINTDGRRIMDFHGNAAHHVGYGHPRVVQAMREQIETLPFCPRRYTNAPAISLAAKLASLAPGDLSKILFAPGGTSAIGMALKLARHVTGRHKTVSMWDSFHGASLDAISVGGEAQFRRGAGPLLPGTEHVPPPSLARRFFGDDAEAPLRLADYIDYVLGVQGDVGAVIAEPMRWTTVEPPPPGFWQRVRQSCDRHGALLIFDEIPSGLGRSGTMFVTEQTGVVPDMLVLGKGLGGGIFPLAALIARGDLDAVSDRAIGHYTHEKSPVGCAAALATLSVIEEEGLVAKAADLGAWALDDLRRRVGALPGVRAVRGLGLYFGIEVESAARADSAMYRSLERCLSFKIGGGNVITLCPPLTISEAELAQAFDIVTDVLRNEA
ncbi:4-aminobutyrate aminotransferase [Rhizomicrobium palustre]|uniref:4-aminobutyrate aminotransferase n=1 Tax=Rhizomicrobium palustre TaxID=189966 RepID=A0A846N2H7_9PROT|nr:aspartate aminotransferase family protein [Rhizomicrobium palustre]NIK89813.1 4-aminobutyrate aminotransferase [Rhizomicrobium palustre]